MWLSAGRWSYHGGVESRHDRVMDFAAAVLLVLAGFNHGDDFVGVSGLLHVGQSRGPGRRAHQPHEGKDSSHSQVLKNTQTHKITQNSMMPSPAARTERQRDLTVKLTVDPIDCTQYKDRQSCCDLAHWF